MKPTVPEFLDIMDKLQKGRAEGVLREKDTTSTEEKWQVPIEKKYQRYKKVNDQITTQAKKIALLEGIIKALTEENQRLVDANHSFKKLLKKIAQVASRGRE